MTGQQLDLFSVLNTAAQLAEQANDDTQPEESRSAQPHDHAGQLGDDGSLHYMLTGQPEPRKAA